MFKNLKMKTSLTSAITVLTIICITIFMSSILKSSDKLSDEKFGRE